MKTIHVLAALAAVLTGSLTARAAEVTELTLNTASAPSEQGWEKIGGIEVKVNNLGIVIDDQSQEDFIAFKQSIPAELEAAIQEKGFELTVDMEIEQTEHSVIEIDVAGAKILAKLHYGNRQQIIGFWDPVYRKHLTASLRNETFNTWKIVWKPTDEGHGTVEVFVGDIKLTEPVHCGKSRSKTSCIAIGSFGPSGKERTGSITVKNLSLKALKI